MAKKKFLNQKGNDKRKNFEASERKNKKSKNLGKYNKFA